jgi:hypothetical protein
MSLLTGETDVFSSAAASGRCAVIFLAKDQDPGIEKSHLPSQIEGTMNGLAGEGWILSPRAMIDPGETPPATGFATGFAHDVDLAGMFEAPSINAAFAGIRRLERAGWAERFATQWLIGPREFAAVKGAPVAGERDWGFLALWEWNDAWSAASQETRDAYDRHCDVAFAGDLALGANIAGRHRLDWASSWHHIGFWEIDHPKTVDLAMREHERVADFMFTTSRHYIGRRCDIVRYLAGMTEQLS